MFALAVALYALAVAGLTDVTAWSATKRAGLLVVRRPGQALVVAVVVLFVIAVGAVLVVPLVMFVTALTAAIVNRVVLAATGRRVEIWSLTRTSTTTAGADADTVSALRGYVGSVVVEKFDVVHMS